MSPSRAWEPTGYYTDHARIVEFMYEYGYDEYAELIPSDDADLRRIWGDFAEDTGIVWEEDYEAVINLSDGVPFADWYTGGRLNAIETILDQWVERTPDTPMYIWEDEAGNRSSMTYAEIHRRSSQMATALRASGIETGDVVGILFPMHPNGFITALACLRIGAVFSMIFPGYGAEAIKHRLNDSSAKLLVMSDGHQRGGEITNLLSKVELAVRNVPTLNEVIVHGRYGFDTDLPGVPQRQWETFLQGQEAAAETAVMDSDDAAFIAYSSGTTGVPKGTIHTHASLLVMGNKEAKYHFDIGQGDTLLWVTDFGWIIVPIWMLAGAPALGARTVLLDGAPMSPETDRIWRAIDEYDVTTFGIAPTGARHLREATPSPQDDYDLSSLRILASTGEPWNEKGWYWFRDAIGNGKLPIINASGGTELAGAILSPTPTTPLKPGTLYGPAPGVAANIYAEGGSPADEGYLVIERPIPGMTHGLTSGRERYLAEYWSDFEGVWNHNDWAERDEDGFWFITGRADDTMNIAGRRVTAPTIEEAIATHAEVADIAVVSVADDVTGQTPVAFVVCSHANVDEETLRAEIRSTVSEALGKPFQPSSIHVVPAIPRTQTGKIPRGVLESVYSGNSPGNVSTLTDADALEQFPRHNPE